jgi:hypothetical protein
MLRRGPDNTYEYRDIERMLYSIHTPALAPQRKDALRARIMARLGHQDERRRVALPLIPEFREKWVAIPAGVGLAAAIIAGMNYYEGLGGDGGTLHARLSGPVTVDGAYSDRAEPGDLLVALSAADIDIGTQFRVSLEAGARFSYYESDGRVTFRPFAGTATLVTGDRDAFLIGDGWTGRILSGSLAEFTVSAEALTVHVTDGTVWVTVGNEPELRLTEGLPAITVSLTGGNGAPEQDIFPPAWHSPATGGGSLPGYAGDIVDNPLDTGGENHQPQPAEGPQAPASPAVVTQPAAGGPPAVPDVPANPPAGPPSPAFEDEPGADRAVAPAPPFGEGGAFEDGNPAGVITPVGDGDASGDPPGSTVEPPAHGQGAEPGSSGSNGAASPASGNGPDSNSSGGANNGSVRASAAATGLDPLVLTLLAAESLDSATEADASIEMASAGATHPGKADPPGNALGLAKEWSGSLAAAAAQAEGTPGNGQYGRADAEPPGSANGKKA